MQKRSETNYQEVCSFPAIDCQWSPYPPRLGCLALNRPILGFEKECYDQQNDNRK